MRLKNKTFLALASLSLALFPERCQTLPMIENDEDSLRIVNGTKAEPGQFPFAVSLQVMLTRKWHLHICTLSLITTKTCLGAAHCAFGENQTLIETSKFCGIVGTIKQTMKGECHKYSEVRWHEDYDPEEVINDIATFIFAKEMKLHKEFLDVVPLIAADAIIKESSVTALGWGNLHNLEEAVSPTILRYVELELLPLEKCDAIKTQLCISTKKKGICAGDSGGPSVITRSDKQIQVGVSSYVGWECAVSFSVLTAVGPFMDWIRENSVGEPTFVSE